jgi:acyl carrier protein
MSISRTTRGDDQAAQQTTLNPTIIREIISFDESAISIQRASQVLSVFAPRRAVSMRRPRPSAGWGETGKTMDARVVPQMYCDADAVRRFIAEYAGIDLKHVTDETHLTDLGLDWLDQLDLMVLIEDELVGVDFFANTTAANIELVGDLIRHIEHHNATTARRTAA